MNYRIELPSARADAVQLADWIELVAIRESDGSSSYEALASAIHTSGTTDVSVAEELDGDEEDADDEGAHISYDDDSGGEYSTAVADRAWVEIERRSIACHETSYPFDMTDGSITLREEWESTAYVFQLLLAHFGKSAGPQGTYGERLFEHLSSLAGQAYLGGANNSARHFRFAFPRPDRSGFAKAVKSLCTELCAGIVKEDAALIAAQQDSHLDVVVWRPFVDSQASQLIGFGQCATGGNWEAKLSELQPSNFAEDWLTEHFHPMPVRMFFVPRCIENDRWRHVSIHAGIVFDRCRIASLVGQLPNEIEAEFKAWSEYVVAQVREESP